MKKKRRTAAEWERQEKYLNAIIHQRNETIEHLHQQAQTGREVASSLVKDRDVEAKRSAYYRGMLLTFVRTLSLTVDGVMAQLGKDR